MKNLSLEIPEDVAQAMRLPPPEIPDRLRLELAVGLYAQEVLGLGKAAQLAGLTRWQLNAVLAKRQVPMHYAAAELEEDVAYARNGE